MLQAGHTSPDTRTHTYAHRSSGTFLHTQHPPWTDVMQHSTSADGQRDDRKGRKNMALSSLSNQVLFWDWRMEEWRRHSRHREVFVHCAIFQKKIIFKLWVRGRGRHERRVAVVAASGEAVNILSQAFPCYMGFYLKPSQQELTFWQQEH